MLSRETLEMYRRMTVGQRLSLVMRMTDEQTNALLYGPPELVQRRFRLLRLQNDARNRGMGECIARTRDPRHAGN